MDTLKLNKVMGLRDVYIWGYTTWFCTQSEVYMCTSKWIKRIVVVCEIWTTHQCLWWVCTHVGGMINFCRRCFIICEVFVYTCIKLTMDQGIYMCKAIHVSRYIHVHHNSSQNTRVQYPHVHQDLISTCTLIYQYRHVHFEIYKQLNN